MSQTNRPFLTVFSLMVLLTVAVLSGCSTEPAKDGAQAGGGAETIALGKTAFETSCARCHSIGGGRRSGPDLGHTGAEAEHTAQWLTEFIKNPSSKKPGSSMPGFEGKIPDKSIEAISAYLVTLK